MLTEELNRLRQWAASENRMFSEAALGELCSVIIECNRVREAWTAASFSDVPDETLKRYFNYHLKELTAISEHAGSSCDKCITDALLGLTDHLWQYYQIYLDDTVIVSNNYQSRFAVEIAPAKIRLCKSLDLAAISSKLKSCLSAFLVDMAVDEAGRRFTYRSLRYFKRWLDTLNAHDLQKPTDELLVHTTLELLNFNNLSYLYIRQEMLSSCKPSDLEKVQYLRNEQSRLSLIPHATDLSCHPEWPSLAFMLCGWISEEVHFLTAQSPLKAVEVNLPPEKYPLRLSVAHIGCLLHLFCDADFPGDRNLSHLFDFVTRHFSAKRQEQISAHSLSNAYYGTTQVTAAKVQGMLQQMVFRLNRKYFP